MNGNYVYAFRFASVTKLVLIFKHPLDCDKILRVNNFVQNFSINFQYPEVKKGKSKEHCEFWVDCSKDFFDVLHTETMRRAFDHMGMKLVFEYPFMEEFKK